jgi:cobalamin transport system substrate-binding protein
MLHLSGRREAAFVGTVLAIVFAASACGSGSGSGSATRTPSSAPAPTSPASQFPVTMTDDDGVSVTIPAKPARIITFAPSNTEIVFGLGLGDALVGVSGSFDNYPPAATSIEQVGGSGEFGVDPNVEKVVALHPDLMLTIAGGDQWKERLRDLGIPVFTINATDFDDLLHDIRTVGVITGASGQADALAQQMSNRAAAVEPSGPPVSCFFEVFYPPLTTVGPHTFIFDLLRRAGCDAVSANATSDYPEWSVESLVAEGPAVYLVASESGVSPKAVAKRPGFSAIEAVAQGKVFLVDSDLIGRPGPRVVDGLESLVQLLHP